MSIRWIIKENNEKNNDFDKLINAYIIGDGTYTTLSDDKDNGHVIETGIADRDVYYKELLGNYKRLTRVRNILKEIHKWLFFWFIIIACFVIIAFLIQYICSTKSNISENYVAVITAIVSLTTTVISIPLIITKYLFNTKEDDNITQIISKTQEHDTAEIELLIDRFKNVKTPYLAKTGSNPNSESKSDDLEVSEKSSKDNKIEQLKEMIPK